jgi:hypothetical protein
MVVTAIVNSFGVHVPPQAVIMSEPIKKIGQHTVVISHGGHNTDIRVTIEKNGK